MPGLAMCGLLPAALVPSTSSAALALPSPCTIAPASFVAGALDVHVGAVHGVLKTQKSNGVTIKTCTFTAGAV